MIKQQWDVRFSPVALQDKYKIPRGEAALFRDAVSVLFVGPHPAGAEAAPNAANAFQYWRNGYMIVYEVLQETRTNRIVYFDRLESLE